MTYEQLYTHATELNGGAAINATLFSQLIKAEKGKIERDRPWEILKEVDTSITLTPSDTYETAKTAPDGYIMDDGRYAVRLVAADGAEMECVERPLKERHALRNQAGYYFVDRKNAQVYFSGTRDRTYTVWWAMTKETEDLDADSRSPSEWEFPPEYHPLLVARVLITHKGGADIDEINARMTAFHGRDVNELWNSMVHWDAALGQNKV